MKNASAATPGWAERVAVSLGGGPHVVMSGISPSGNIHVGNLREVLVAEAVARALWEQGEQARLIFHADTMDPLRKISAGAPAEFERYIGHSLSSVPDPQGCHESYAEHFLAPFEAALEEMGVEIEVLRSHELYEQGVYTGVTREALECAEELRSILQEVSGREMPEGWSPYLPRAASGDLTGNRVLEHVPQDDSVVFEDREGERQSADYSRGEGKLGWRVELAARWKALGVTFEPFGKDHTSRGGSTDTADRMTTEVFDYPVPGRYHYEWLQIRGVGAMSSSKGVVLLPGDLLRIMPPEALRQMVLGRDPSSAHDIDLGEGFPQFMDQYLASVEREPVPFSHLVTLSQTVGEDASSAAEMLGRGGYADAAADTESVGEKLHYAYNWAREWAPDSYRFEILEEMPEAAHELDEEQRHYLGVVAGRLDSSLDGDDMQNMLYATAKEMAIKPKKAFSAIYVSLLGEKSGPRAGPFLASVPAETVRGRFLECEGIHKRGEG